MDVDGRLRVHIAVDPYVLRSALHTLLSDDDRFASVLRPDGTDPADHASAAGADVLVVTRRVVYAGQVRVLTVTDTTVAETLSGGTINRSYCGWNQFADLIASAHIDASGVISSQPGSHLTRPVMQIGATS